MADDIVEWLSGHGKWLNHVGSGSARGRWLDRGTSARSVHTELIGSVMGARASLSHAGLIRTCGWACESDVRAWAGLSQMLGWLGRWPVRWSRWWTNGSITLALNAWWVQCSYCIQHMVSHSQFKPRPTSSLINGSSSTSSILTTPCLGTRLVGSPVATHNWPTSTMMRCSVQ
jgi:hypothetical protein